MTPIRIQRKRTKGWRMPPDTVSVTRPGKWGNPFRVGGYYSLDAKFGLMMWCQRAIWKEADKETAIREGFTLIRSPQHAVDWFRRLTAKWSDFHRDECRAELGGKNLACYCPLGQPCHADVLLEIANSEGAR